MRRSASSPLILIRFPALFALLAGIAILPGGMQAGRFAQPFSNPQPAPDTRTPVLVELFTSEGCSSCPDADKLLAQLDARQPIQGVEVIVLEHHVNYWDDQGWRDPFSSAAATDRQRKYAFVRHGEGDQVYTPQMIVDGGAQFNGSNAPLAQKAIEQAAKAPKTAIQLAWSGASTETPRELHVQIAALDGAASGDKPEVFLAITESQLHSNVRRGENAGRSLDHAGVVRELASIGHVNPQGNAGETFDTEARVKLGRDWNPQNVRAVVFIQDTHTGRVFGAAEVPY
jgi:hypothetical protein